MTEFTTIDLLPDKRARRGSPQRAGYVLFLLTTPSSNGQEDYYLLPGPLKFEVKSNYKQINNERNLRVQRKWNSSNPRPPPGGGQQSLELTTKMSEEDSRNRCAGRMVVLHSSHRVRPPQSVDCHCMTRLKSE